MKFFKTLLGAALLIAFVGVSEAQVPSINYTQPAQLQSYRATITGLVPAAGATDFFTISGTGNVKLRMAHCDGLNTSGTQAVLITAIKRSTLDTGGSSTAPTSVRLNANFPVATATLKAFTANPTLGTAIGTLAEGILVPGTTASPTFNNQGVTFDFSNQNLWLDATATSFALNANAPTWNNGTTLNCWIEWTEQ